MTMGKKKGTNRVRPILHSNSAICDVSWMWFAFPEGLGGKRLTDNSLGVNTFQDYSLGKDPICLKNAWKRQKFW